MTEYRIVPVDDAAHINGPATELDCPDDEAALREAQALLIGQPAEVWNRARLVAVLINSGGPMCCPAK